MVDFIRKRLQVFVSSTFTDLRQERQAAVEAILTAGHIPAGMELFTSGDESQVEVIKQWIDQSDIFLLILGGRYGSLEPQTGKSYIQLEYEYAAEKGKRLFACVVREDAQEKRLKEFGSDVTENYNPQKLKEFRALVRTRVIREWADFKDIKIAVGESLAQYAMRDDLMGWVRPSQEANIPALADEIARLSKENAELRSQIARIKPEETINGLSFQELKAILESEGLLSYLENNGHYLADYYGVEGHEREIAELNQLGIVKRLPEFEVDKYGLTDAGRVFINKLKAQKLSLQTEK